MPKQTFFNLSPEKRANIIDIAIEEFASHTYSKASISKIVAKAGIAKGSMYQYFEDKKDLFKYILNLAVQEKINYIEKYGINQGEDFFTAFEKTMLAGTQFSLDHPQIGKIFSNAMEPTSEEILKELNAEWRPMTLKFFEDLIEKGKSEGSIRQETNARLVSHMLVSLLGVGLTDYLLEKLEISMDDFFYDTSQVKKLAPKKLEQIIKDIMDFIRNGLGSKG